MKSTQLLQSKAYDYLKDLILNDKLEHGVIYSQKKWRKNWEFQKHL